MIYGIGIDLVKIQRLKEVVEKWDRRFLEKVYTDSEIAYSYEKKDPYLSLAVRFAAKEALIKAIGFEMPVSPKDIEVVNLTGGKPSLKISGKLKRFFDEKGIRNAHLSLSHEKEYGVACVIVEG
ncbi:MAG: holo-ACP synthase [Nitrospirae bacterium]|nr:holo-ACP synthase [Nitrospirota bacterium]